MKKEYLECGKICSPHGIRAAVKVESYCDSPAVLAKLKRVYLERAGSYEEREVKSASVGDRFVIMQLSGIDSREDAQAYKNRLIFARREDIPIPKGRVLIADMIGLDVIDADTGRVYGTLTEVNDGVRSQLYTIKTKSGEVLFPAVKEFIEEIDVERGVFIHTIPGFFEDEI
ncbi:MAG: 16S rRNA processing protein RimM [Clostridia bacterium]|nr:16S rRNA processing protein RimM [Clostridia bacterium]